MREREGMSEREIARDRERKNEGERDIGRNLEREIEEMELEGGNEK